MPPKQEIILSPMAEMSEAWTRWREEVPEEEREAVADLLEKADLDTRPGINQFAKDVLVATFRGTLSPVVLQAAKPWIELVLFNIDSMNQAAGVGQSGTTVDIVNFMGDLKKSWVPLQPVYQVVQIPEKQRDLVEAQPPKEEAG